MGIFEVAVKRAARQYPSAVLGNKDEDPWHEWQPAERVFRISESLENPECQSR